MHEKSHVSNRFESYVQWLERAARICRYALNRAQLGITQTASSAYAACWPGSRIGDAGVIRRWNSRAAISGDRSFENPHWRHFRNVPWVSVSALMSPVQRGQDFKYSISVLSPVVQDRFRSANRLSRSCSSSDRLRHHSFCVLALKSSSRSFLALSLDANYPRVALDQFVVGTLFETKHNGFTVGKNRTAN